MKSDVSPNILVTGGTGFLGKHVVDWLKKKFNVYVLSRSAHTELRGDILNWNCGLNKDQLPSFAALIHLAGLYDLRASRDACVEMNVVGTSNVLKLAQDLKIPLFINASSVAASINSPLPTILPHDHYLHTRFPDYYSESKAHAEKLIENWRGGLQTKINLRFGVLIGSTEDGKIERIDGPYHCIEAFKKGLALIKSFPGPLILPGDSRRTLPLLPVNVAAQAVQTILTYYLQTKEEGYLSFHLTPERGLLLSELYQKTLAHLGLPDKKVLALSRIPQGLAKRMAHYLLHLPKEELHYVLNFPQYDSSATRKLLGETWCPEFKDYEASFWRGYEEFTANR